MCELLEGVPGLCEEEEEESGVGMELWGCFTGNLKGQRAIDNWKCYDR